ncbi:hypothetical protein ANCDUO_21377 [Ancylostoma duodenale]|uniref:Uncharacterized protein n=1 Tax=Ancylostoma duodenale TaxID=51022 RepID=A0A0C2BX50_9BILA|nr:hypothetical protein ANCDUO_21377 [Ancylostoma duodenale]
MEPFPCGDRRLPHHVFPPKKITADQLLQLTGVIYYKVRQSGSSTAVEVLLEAKLTVYLLQVDLDDTVAMKKRLSRVKNERKVNSSDMLTINDSTPDINDKVRESFV